MARRTIGLGIFALWVWQAGCSASDERPTVSASRDSGVSRDAEPPETPDAAPDEAAVRGETPSWPEAEQEVELPYGGEPTSVLLVTDASPSALDVHLNVDTTGSIRFAIDELQSALRGSVIDRLHAKVEDVAFGVSRYADFPVAPFGWPGDSMTEADQPFVLLSPITTNVDRVIAAVGRLDQPLDIGGDLPEASAEALYQIATGEGFVMGTRRLIERRPALAAFGGGTLGGVGFRDFALHVVLHVADSPAHRPEDYLAGGLMGTHSLEDASEALQKLGVRVVSILPTECTVDQCADYYRYVRGELEQLSLENSTSLAAVRGMCPMGIAQASVPARDDRCPLVYDVRQDGTGLSRTISDAVIALLEEVRFGEVHAEGGDDRLHFVSGIRVEPVDQPSGVHVPETRDFFPEGAKDGVADSYVEVERRSLLGFRVTLQNQHIAPRDVAQRFRVGVRVVGDHVLLEERLLRVVVPARGADATDPESSRHVALDASTGDLDAGP